MKTGTTLITVTFCLSLCATGCVRRIVTEEPKYGNSKTKNQYGDAHTKHIDNKIIWFWQDEFRNPGK